jgi:hypothetical protein
MLESSQDAGPTRLEEQGMHMINTCSLVPELSSDRVFRFYQNLRRELAASSAAAVRMKATSEDLDMEFRVDELLSQSSRRGSRKGSTTPPVRGRGRPRKHIWEDNSHSADGDAEAAVHLGKRSRAAASADGDAHSQSALRENEANAFLDLPTRSHLAEAAARDAPVAALAAIAMEEISKFSAVDFTSLVTYLDLQAPPSSGGIKFVAHSAWEHLHFDSKGVVVAESPA